MVLMAAKRKVSAYNRHVGREMKAGKTMKQAAASWRGGTRPSSSPSRRRAAPRRGKTTTKKITRSRGGFKLGGFSPSGILKAGAVYLGTILVSTRIVPQVGAVPGGIEAATGAVAMATGLPGAAFLALGAAKFVAMYGLRLVSGAGINGNGGGGYDY